MSRNSERPCPISEINKLGKTLKQAFDDFVPTIKKKKVSLAVRSLRRMAKKAKTKKTKCATSSSSEAATDDEQPSLIRQRTDKPAETTAPMVSSPHHIATTLFTPEAMVTCDASTEQIVKPE